MGAFDGFWGAVIGGLVGAVGTGSAQVWSFRKGRKTARDEQAHRAAGELLEVLHTCDRTLPTLRFTHNAPGSPLSYGQRLDIARPMLDLLNHADFTLIPLLTSTELGERFSQFSKLCERVSGPEVDAQDLDSAVKQIREYGTHIRTCLIAETDNKPLPPPATVPHIGR